METREIESYIAGQKMISLGNRRPDILGSKAKIIGWSSNLIKEFGVGYRTMVINSLGDQFGDKKSRDEIDQFFDDKDMDFAKLYIDKMANLDKKTLEKISQNPDADCADEFSYLLTYFIVVRWVIEGLYEKLNEEDRKCIDEWRNNEHLFSSMDKFYKDHPKNNDPKEWSAVGIGENIYIVEKIISCNVNPGKIENTTEIKGSIGYSGIVSGRARVFTSDEDINLVEDGEIIIAPMTTLDFLPAMKKAAAFVTDEGGVTCHAAIVAREMKKPCIIGTRIGTKVFKTGDMIEVDATKGIVRIIK